MVRFYFRVITFFIGISLGALLAIQFKKYLGNNADIEVPHLTPIPSYNSWFAKLKLQRKQLQWDTLRYNKLSTHKYSVESQFLSNKITILCIIIVHNLKNAAAIEDTWGKGCNSIKFIEINVKHNKTVVIKRTKENSSWVLLCQYLKTVRYDDYDWVLVARDTTFAIPENLRYYVAGINSLDKHYLGHTVSFWNTVYNSGEAGYILSKGSLRAFSMKLEETGCSTNVYWNREDFYLGRFLSTLNITPTETKDSDGLSLFHPNNLYQMFFPGEDYFKTSVYPIKCCSKKSITFQAIERDKIYLYYYLLYTLQVFSNGTLGNTPAPTTVPDDYVWKQFLKERNIPSDNVTGEQYYKVWENLIQDPTLFAAHMKKEMHFDYD